MRILHWYLAGLMEYICMWIFKVGKFEYIDIWQVLSKKKNLAGCWNSWKEIEKKNLAGCWKLTVGIVKFEKVETVEFEKEMALERNNKEKLKNNILIKW